MTRWKFGVGQTPAEERAEIKAAKKAGLGEAYVRGQTCLRMIEAETARRRTRKAGKAR